MIRELNIFLRKV